MTTVASQFPSVFDRYESTRLPVRRFSVDEYHRMIDDGYFAHDERFELLEGWIVAKVPRTPPHDAHVAIARRALAERLDQNWHVRVQSAVTLVDSEPEPDLAVVIGTEVRYVTHHPKPDEIALVVEVSSTTLDEDRDVKARIYARSRVRSYWIINLVDRKVEVNWNPSGPTANPRFLNRAEFNLESNVTLKLDNGVAIEIPISEFLPTFSNT